jgi:hypothetical protein
VHSVVQWGAGIVFGLSVAGILVCAAKFVRTHAYVDDCYGGGGQRQSSLIWAYMACVLAGSVSGIVGVLA